MIKLKACPFCGGAATSGVDMREMESSCDVTLIALVGCAKCNIFRGKRFKAVEGLTLVPFERFTDAFQAAVDSWNNRAGDKRMEADDGNDNDT